MSHPIPKGDVLIHSGDISNKGGEKDVTNFVHWFQNIDDFQYKIFIAGNHDFCFEKVDEPHHRGDYGWLNDLMDFDNLVESNVFYLQDEFIVINSPEFSRPIKIYGSPWQPNFYDWAFNLPRMGDELKTKWDMIPDDTDVLITHGPPNEIRDFVSNWRQGDMNVGCELLRHQLDDRLNPVLHVFGHIHGAYGAVYNKETLYVNASTCTDRYEPSNKPIIVDLTEVDGKIIATYVEE
jgi:3',5'-cyclic AMP phosphodiesterase CpdA